MGTRALTVKPHAHRKGLALPDSVHFIWVAWWLGVPTGWLRLLPNSATYWLCRIGQLPTEVCCLNSPLVEM